MKLLFHQKRVMPALLLAFFVSAAPALAHVSERALVQLLPTEVYTTAGVLAVVATFLVLVFFPVRLVHGLFPVAENHPETRNPAIKDIVSLLSFLIFCGLISIGLNGTHDPLSNLLPLTIFSLWWIGLPLLQALFGDAWGWINPWTGASNLLFPEKSPFQLTPWLGVWPAIILYIMAAIYALTDIAPMDPERLAIVAAGYWLFTFVMIGLFGRQWLLKGEGLSLFFSLIARLSPLNFSPLQRKPLTLTFPGAKLVHPPFPDVSLAIFCVSLLAIGSFDGLNETFWWVVKLGLNPLEFPGRSAVVVENRLGMMGAVILLNVIFASTVWFGLALVGRRDMFKSLYCRLSLSILPIALGYHFAHFLTAGLLSMQYFILALSDPLDTGANFLRLENKYISTSMFNQLHTVRIIWLAQAAGIVLGHILAIILAHAIALKAFEDRRLAIISQVPIAIFMAVYTLFGLWLLASPTAV